MKIICYDSTFELAYLWTSTQNQHVRSDIAVRARRDGNKRFTRSSKNRTRKTSETNDSGELGAWWLEEDENTTGLPSSQCPSNYLEKLSNIEGEDEEHDWWERDSEGSLDSCAPKQLEQWQKTRLEQVYAVGRKKCKVCSCISLAAPGLHNTAPNSLIVLISRSQNWKMSLEWTGHRFCSGSRNSVACQMGECVLMAHMLSKLPH